MRSTIKSSKITEKKKKNIRRQSETLSGTSEKWCGTGALNVKWTSAISKVGELLSNDFPSAAPSLARTKSSLPIWDLSGVICCTETKLLYQYWGDLRQSSCEPILFLKKNKKQNGNDVLKRAMFLLLWTPRAGFPYLTRTELHGDIIRWGNWLDEGPADLVEPLWYRI